MVNSVAGTLTYDWPTSLDFFYILSVMYMFYISLAVFQENNIIMITTILISLVVAQGVVIIALTMLLNSYSKLLSSNTKQLNSSTDTLISSTEKLIWSQNRIEELENRERYNVVAYRYGTNEHVFPIGVFSSRELANDAAAKHSDYRGGKYKYKIYRVSLDRYEDNSGPKNFLEVSGIFGD